LQNYKEKNPDVVKSVVKRCMLNTLL